MDKKSIHEWARIFAGQGLVAICDVDRLYVDVLPGFQSREDVNFIGQFYALHGSVDDSITLSDESAADLAGIAAMAGAEAFGN